MGYAPVIIPRSIEFVYTLLLDFPYLEASQHPAAQVPLIGGTRGIAGAVWRSTWPQSDSQRTVFHTLTLAIPNRLLIYTHSHRAPTMKDLGDLKRYREDNDENHFELQEVPEGTLFIHSSVGAERFFFCCAELPTPLETALAHPPSHMVTKVKNLLQSRQQQRQLRQPQPEEEAKVDDDDDDDDQDDYLSETPFIQQPPGYFESMRS